MSFAQTLRGNRVPRPSVDGDSQPRKERWYQKDIMMVIVLHALLTYHLYE